MEPDVPVLEPRVREALSGVTGVRVAYLFGSRVRGRARPDSDLDVAVAYDSALGPVERERVRRDLILALTQALGSLGERADVADLDRADSAVGFRAIREGRCVVARTATERVRLEARIARAYDDDAPRRALMRRAAVEAARRLEAQLPARP